ncbi:MAG: hypothetical protein WDN72_01785 [Alphaproteobacteria bacterium]
MSIAPQDIRGTTGSSNDGTLPPRMTVDDYVNALLDNPREHSGLARALVGFLSVYDSNRDHVVDARDYAGSLADPQLSHDEKTLEVMRASHVDIDALTPQIHKAVQDFIARFDANGDTVLQPDEFARANAAIARVTEEVPRITDAGMILYDAAHRGDPAQPYLTNQRIVDTIGDALKHGLPDVPATGGKAR